MKTLLVNCYTKNQERKTKNYLSLLKPFGDVEIVFEKNIEGNFDLHPFDAVVITGSGKDITKGESSEEFLMFLRKMEKPLLGICYGHQVLSHAFGCKVVMGEQMTNPYDQNPHQVRIKEENDLFFGMGPVIEVAEDHHEYVQLEDIKRSPFNLLATSGPCPVEAIQHREKPLYGIQFHPERSGEVGRKILENFYQRIVKKQ